MVTLAGTSNCSSQNDVLPDYGPKDPPDARATADEKRSDWKSTAFSTVKLLLRGVRDSADAFPPLKSVAGVLCFILESSEVWYISIRDLRSSWVSSVRRLIKER